MARLPRLTLPGYPHHAIQRGNGRAALFSDPADYEFMQRLLGEQARQHSVAVHGYVLLPDRFELLLTPATPDAMARLMQAVGRAVVRRHNDRVARGGTLWEGRFRSAPLQPDKFLLACMAYLDLQPVWAGFAETAGDWPWSSHRHYVGRHVDRLVTPHPAYWQLGNTPFARELAYADQVNGQGVPADLRGALSDSALHGWALGDSEFLAELQQRTGRRLTRGRPGRPRAAPK